ncbi:Uncharacterised protein [Vibrio cholerae]|nr:Uncharacterised protein [Vibrio cholerae]
MVKLNICRQKITNTSSGTEGVSSAFQLKSKALFSAAPCAIEVGTIPLLSSISAANSSVAASTNPEALLPSALRP